MQIEEALRDQARALLDVAIDAANPRTAMRRALVENPLPQPAADGQTIVIAVGKAAPAMLAETLEHVTGPCQTLCVTHRGNEATVPGAEVLYASHPVPDAGGLKAGQRVMALLASAQEQDRVVVLVSGGGSALLPAPAGAMTLDDKARVNDMLLASGLGIEQMNLVRQNLSELKGGGMTRLAAPASVSAYILSDVIGDDLRAVASGPTLSALGSRAEACALLKAEKLWEDLPPAARAHLEEDATAQRAPDAPAYLVGSNGQSLAAMQAACPDDWTVAIAESQLIGDVQDAAEQVLNHALKADRSKPVALIFGGETTVRLQGDGKGGRNQELALRFAVLAQEMGLAGPWVFLSGGTDGRDGPTDAAGGVVDSGSIGRLRGQADLDALLANNDSYHALDLSGDLIRMAATGTNVADVQVLLLAPK